MHYNTAFWFLLALGHRGMKDMRDRTLAGLLSTKAPFKCQNSTKKNML